MEFLITDPGTTVSTTSGPLSITATSSGGSPGLLIQEGGIVSSGSTLSIITGNDMEVIGSLALP